MEPSGGEYSGVVFRDRTIRPRKKNINLKPDPRQAMAAERGSAANGVAAGDGSALLQHSRSGGGGVPNTWWASRLVP